MVSKNKSVGLLMASLLLFLFSPSGFATLANSDDYTAVVAIPEVGFDLNSSDLNAFGSGTIIGQNASSDRYDANIGFNRVADDNEPIIGETSPADTNDSTSDGSSSGNSGSISTSNSSNPTTSGISGGRSFLRNAGELCSTATQCLSNQCENSRCSECSQSSECSNDSTCNSGVCVKVTTGTCGEVANHEWVSYECCSNVDCSGRLVCNTSSHRCESSNQPRLEIVLDPPEPLAGSPVTIRVTSGGLPVENVVIFINDEEQFSKNGTVTITLSTRDTEYDLSAVKEGFVSDRLRFNPFGVLSIELSTTNPSAGERVTIQVKDEDEKPASEVELLIVLADGSTQVLKTNAEGIAYLESNTNGKITVNAKKNGFAQAYVLLEVGHDQNNTFLLVIGFFAIAIIIGGIIVWQNRHLRPTHQHKHRSRRKK